LQRIESHLRELRFNPDRHIPDMPATRTIREAKQHWLSVEVPPGSRKARHQQIEAANLDLQPFIAEMRKELLNERERLVCAIRNDRLLGARDYAFCLFPEATLQALLLDKK
jgi:hypothetical protein